MLEREVKLAAPPGFRLPELDGIDGVTATAPERLDRLATYWDAEDLRLVRWGATLRHRAGEGWTVKLPRGEADGLLSRTEIVFPGGPGRPPREAVELLLAHLHGSPLQPVARMRTIRLRVVLRDAEGERAAEIVDDEVSVLEGRRVAARFRELEVELGAASANGLLGRVVARLEAAGAAVQEPLPKLVRALGPRALAPPEVVVPDAGPDSQAGEVVRRALAASVARFLVHDPGVVLGSDAEDTHQARVALRRLRSDLRTFRPLVEDDWCRSLRAEAKWLGALLGEVRDAEVMRDGMRERAAPLPPADRAALAGVLAGLDDVREDARGRLLAARREPRFAALVDRLVHAAGEPALLPEADRPALEVLPPLAARPWRRLRRARKELDADSPDAELHALRLLTKRARYAAEAVAPALGRPARRFARAADKLQDVLGDHQDATLTQAWLRGRAVAATPAQAFACGELCAVEARLALESRAAWPAAWKPLARRGRQAFGR